ncbi:MAG TPA: MFS transporter [Caulobacter sp.]|nr:MFS transporter [Caulobacter sp.]
MIIPASDALPARSGAAKVATPPAKPAVHRQSATVLASATAVSAAAALLFNLMPALLGAASSRFGLDNNQLGIVGFSYLAGFALVATTSNLWIDRFNWRHVIGGATGLSVVGLFLAAVSNSYPGLLMTLGAAGVGLGTLYTVCVAVVSEHHEPDKAFGLKLAGEVLLAIVALVVLTTWIIGQEGFSAAAACLAVLVGVVSLAGLRGIPSGRTLVPPEKRFMMKRRAGSPAPVLKDWEPWLGLAALFVSFAGLSALWAFVSQIAPTFGVSPHQADNALAVTLIVSGIAGLAAAFIGDRLGRARPLAVGLLLAIGGAAALAFGQGFNAYLIGVVLAGGGWNFPMAYQMGMIASSDRRGSVAVLMPAALAVGGAVGPLAAGPLLTSAQGFLPLYATFAATAAVSLVAFVVLGRRLASGNHR